MDLTDLMQGNLPNGLLEQLSTHLGGADKQQTAKAASGIMSMLTAAMARNANQPQGAQKLHNALERDHDGSLLDNVMDLLGGGSSPQPQYARAMNGAGILRHILGGKQNNAIDMVSKMSGLDNNRTGSLMTMLAPILMGALGRQQRQNNLDAGGLSGLLSQVVGGATQQRQEMGLIGRFLDQDGDGSYMDDVAGMGMKMFGKFFRK